MSNTHTTRTLSLYDLISIIPCHTVLVFNLHMSSTDIQFNKQWLGRHGSSLLPLQIICPHCTVGYIRL